MMKKFVVLLLKEVLGTIKILEQVNIVNTTGLTVHLIVIYLTQIDVT